MDVVRTPAVVSTRHVSEFAVDDLVCIGASLITTPAYTVIDCARSLHPREGLVVADSALRNGTVSHERLAAQLACVPANGKGAASATFVVSEADGRSETAIESVSRYEFLAAGIPRAELNVWIDNRRVDFLWERYKLIGEADGIGKYGKTEEEIRANLRAERLRHRQLEDAGYVLVRWLWDEIWRSPHVVVARVVRELEKAGYRAG
jgi:very-short-patch-repair endonuclease